MKGHIAVVHSGIIENYEELRTQLKAKGCVFVSETDTEVIAHLLHTLYDGDMLSTILRAQTMLEGSYALCVLNAEAPDTLYCTRKDSPLAVRRRTVRRQRHSSADSPHADGGAAR